MLQHEHLVGPASNGRHRAEDDPGQDGPSYQAFAGDGILVDLDSDVIPPGPAPEEVAHVQRGREEETPSDPSMEPVEPLMARSHQESNDVVLARQQEQQRQLAHRHVARSIADILPLPLVFYIKSTEGKYQQDDDIGGDEERWSYGEGATDKGPYPQRRGGGISNLSRDGGCGRIPPEQDVLGFGRCCTSFARFEESISVSASRRWNSIPSQ